MQNAGWHYVAGEFRFVLPVSWLELSLPLGRCLVRKNQARTMPTCLRFVNDFIGASADLPSDL